MTDDHKKKAQASIEGMIQRQAMELVAMPPQEREAHYAIIRAALRETATDKRLPPDEANEFIAKMEEWIRAFVKIMDQGGGASGGNA